MTDKIILSAVGNLVDATTAVNTINANSTIIETAFNNTLSLDGTQPNQMGANLDMNSHHILNLPAPSGILEPVRVTDLNTFAGGGSITVNSLPVGGSVGQLLTKTGSPDYQAGWTTLNASSGSLNLFYNPSTLENCGLAASVASNALTISLKIQDGTTNPSSTSQSTISFRNATLGTGSYTPIAIQTTTSLTISSGSTLGAPNATAFRIWIVAFNDAGTVRLGAINCRSSNQIFSLNEDILNSSTAEGGLGSSDSAGVIYSSVSVANKAMRIIGYMEWSSGLSTAGTWNQVPTKIQMMTTGIRRPGDIVQSNSTSFAAGSGGSTASAVLVPTNTSANITLSSAANSVFWSFTISTVTSKTGAAAYGNLLRGGVTISPQFLGAYGTAPSDSANVVMAHLEGGDFPGSPGPFTYTVNIRSGGTASTVYWNDSNSGGYMTLAEIMC